MDYGYYISTAVLTYTVLCGGRFASLEQARRAAGRAGYRDVVIRRWITGEIVEEIA